MNISTFNLEKTMNKLKLIHIEWKFIKQDLLETQKSRKLTDPKEKKKKEEKLTFKLENIKSLENDNNISQIDLNKRTKEAGYDFDENLSQEEIDAILSSIRLYYNNDQNKRVSDGRPISGTFRPRYNNNSNKKKSFSPRPPLARTHLLIKVKDSPRRHGKWLLGKESPHTSNIDIISSLSNSPTLENNMNPLKQLNQSLQSSSTIPNSFHLFKKYCQDTVKDNGIARLPHAIKDKI